MPALPSSSSAAPPAQSTSSGPPPSSPSYSRLHITPFDADLLKTVVPASALRHARNISFHTLETFPENRYGFVELPAADAEKVKRKFHGSTLRGQKMRVEKARPEKIPEPTADEEEVTSKKRKKRSSDGNDGDTDKKKKRRRDVNTFEGVLLPEGRKVKRGWTVTAEEARREAKKNKNKKGSKGKGEEEKEKKKSKKVVKSKYTDKEECLMKVVLPQNAPALVDSAADEKRKRKKKKAKSQREVVVHEFENTKKFPSFIKTTIQATESTVAAPSAPVPVKVASPEPRPKARTVKEQAPKEEPKPAENDSSEDDSSSSSDSDSSSDSSDGESEAEPVDVHTSSSESESEDDKDEPALPAKESPPPTETRPKSSSSMKNLSITIPPHPTTPAKVHPLEALYKRTNADTATSSAPAAEPFTFFGGADEEDDDEEEEDDPSSLPPPGSQPPMTPFTRQDFELRNIRSAAPTPDTAHPSRTRGFWEPSHEDDIDEEDEEQQPTSPLRPSPSRGTEENKDVAMPVGDFQNWFYENRRELNRSWMNRRRTAKKERRQRENRARAPRG